MPNYKYKGFDKRGKLRSGAVFAKSKGEVRLKLHNKGLKRIKIIDHAAARGTTDGENQIIWGPIYRDAAGTIQISLGEAKPKIDDLVVFTKQFSTMIGSGVPIIQSLMVLSKQQKTASFRRSLTKIQNMVENGLSLSKALAQDESKIFDPLYVAMVEAGEESGNLDEILVRLVDYIEKSQKIKKQVKSAMIYPVLVVMVALAVISGLLIFVVPAFAKQFEDSNKELPFLTQIVMDISDHFIATAPYYFVLLVGAFFAVTSYRKTEQGRIFTDKLLLKAPVIGDLLRKIAVGRFCSTMSSMLGAGVNLLESLSICARSAGNSTVEEAIEKVRKDLEEGLNLSESLSQIDLFPDMVISMVHVGESTGALSEMLMKISEFYEEEVDNAVAAMLAMIEPVMIVIIGALVGFIVIAMYLPIFDLAGGVA